jgi:hypothetical protein
MLKYCIILVWTILGYFITTDVQHTFAMFNLNGIEYVSVPDTRQGKLSIQHAFVPVTMQLSALQDMFFYDTNEHPGSANCVTDDVWCIPAVFSSINRVN